MPFDPKQPYNDLPDLPPQVDLETKASLRAAIRAHRALAELKGVGELLPNQSVLISTVSLQEAQASSEIEGIVTTNDNLFRVLSQTSDVANDPAAKEAFRYSKALWHGHAELKAGRRLSTELYESIVSILLDEPIGVRSTGVHIGNRVRGDVIYRPPLGEDLLRDKLTGLNAYIDQEDDTDPLIKLAAIHYQFEAIHPFHDGNGRTGRILNILYLLQAGLLELPVLYLSRYVIDHKRDYYRLLRHVTETGEWEAWVLYMLSAVETTARDTLTQVLAIRDLMSSYLTRIRAALPKIYSKELVEQLFDRPYCKIGFLVDQGIAKRETASKYLQELESAGFLESSRIGRETVYVNREFLNLLRRRPVDLID
jgi:Fic family protein